MPTVTIRVSEDTKRHLDANAQRSGQTISDYIREALDLRDPDLMEIVEDHERRLRRLEELAGL
jgi:predicted DNA-binding protein